MTALNWRYEPAAVLGLSPVIPVVVIDDIEDALPLASAVLEGGIKTIEITLRTEVALDAIRLIRDKIPNLVVGAGTVLNAQQLEAATAAKAEYAISPGLTPALLDAAKGAKIPLIPGITTLSELMLGLEADYSNFKFFPAEAAGGKNTLKAFNGPFPDVRFCPTGGIDQNNFQHYLALPNVACVGGSWLVSPTLIKAGNFTAISERCQAVLATR